MRGTWFPSTLLASMTISLQDCNKAFVFCLRSGEIKRVSGRHMIQTQTHYEIWSRTRQFLVEKFRTEDVLGWRLEQDSPK